MSAFHRWQPGGWCYRIWGLDFTVTRSQTHLTLLGLRVLEIKRPPDFVIGDPANPYMHRWYVIPRNAFFNIYLHHILRSDNDIGLHDHPYVNCSVVLDGEYTEILQASTHARQAGSLVLRWANTAHRIVIDKPVISLFITGPRVRTWGFHVPTVGWVPHHEVVERTDTGSKPLV
jgi:hypothetical protein